MFVASSLFFRPEDILAGVLVMLSRTGLGFVLKSFVEVCEEVLLVAQKLQMYL